MRLVVVLYKQTSENCEFIINVAGIFMQISEYESEASDNQKYL